MKNQAPVKKGAKSQNKKTITKNKPKKHIHKTKNSTSSNQNAPKNIYRYDSNSGKFVLNKGKKGRTTGQSSTKVQKKIVKRMKKDIPASEQTDIHKKFLKGGGTEPLKKMEVNIAHGVSAKENSTSIASLANKSKTISKQKQQKFNKEALEIEKEAITTDASDLSEFEEDLKDAMKDKLPNQTQMEKMTKVATRVSNSSKNLVAGDEKVNMEIKRHRDVLITKSKKTVAYIEGKFIAQDKIQKLAPYPMTEFQPIKNKFGTKNSSFDKSAKFNQ